MEQRHSRNNMHSMERRQSNEERQSAKEKESLKENREVILRTAGLTKQYPGACAVDDVSLSIYRGDIFGFVGANGAGKTTFMRMVCGLIHPTAGCLELFGVSSERELQEKRKKMGALIEHPAVYTNMTALQNLDVQRRYLEMDFGKNPEKALAELLELVGLADVRNKKARKFSLGMRQRLGLAMALVGNPEFVILDEPTIGLDPLGVMELRELVLKLNRERGLTILFSSHNLAEMAHIATRYGFLDKGKLLETVTAEEVRRVCKDREIDLETYFVELLMEARGSARLKLQGK